jgi:RHS repeat-associated protein
LNQYTGFGTETYTYDLAGNLTSKTDGDRKFNFEYDYQNRLIRTVTPDGTWDYEYDALGNRSAVIHDGQRTEYLADPLAWGVIFGEFSPDGTVQAHNAYGLGLVSRVDNAGELYYDYDALGSTVGITDLLGISVNRYLYLPFGETLDEVETRANPHKFGGRYGLAEDGTGLVRMGARYYDPDSGRFTTQDPIGLFGGDSNLYRYVGNDVVGAVDPSGLAKSGGPKFDWWLGPVDGKPGNFGATKCDSADNCTIKFDITNPAWPCIIMHELIHWANRDDYLGGGQSHDSCIREEILASRVGQACAKRMGYSKYEEFQGAKADGLEQGKPYDNCDKKPGPRYKPPPPPGDPAGGGKPAAPADPNAKTGPGGIGSGAHVDPIRVVPYRIDFENEPDATAPAQFVVVTDQLDANFDWDSFELTEIGFGDQLIVVPPGQQQFATRVPLTQNGEEFEVQIRVGIDLATGQIAARFMSIDPETDLPPNVLTGFLPPENGTGRGQGHISYVIRPKSSLVTGTEIRNVAIIVFDFGDTIATNQRDPHDPSKGTDPDLEALVTIDARPPSSRVLPLPAQTQGTRVRVSWAGQDDDGGSGVAHYNIYVSDNGGDWTPWRTGVTETSGLFTGSLNHAYAFYSVARDWVGHEESPPAAADAVTTMVAQLPTIVFPKIRYSEGSIRISWPSAMEGFYLETADTLEPPIPWERVETVPQIDGDERTIIIEVSEGARFYRLVEP